MTGAFSHPFILLKDHSNVRHPEYIGSEATFAYYGDEEKKSMPIKFRPLSAEELIKRYLRRMVAVVVAATRMFGIVDAIHRGVRLH